MHVFTFSLYCRQMNDSSSVLGKACVFLRPVGLQSCLPLTVKGRRARLCWAGAGFLSLLACPYLRGAAFSRISALLVFSTSLPDGVVDADHRAAVPRPRTVGQQQRGAGAGHGGAVSAEPAALALCGGGGGSGAAPPRAADHPNHADAHGGGAGRHHPSGQRDRAAGHGAGLRRRNCQRLRHARPSDDGGGLRAT